MSPSTTLAPPPKASEPTVAVFIVAADSGAQIIVYDASFQPIEYGIGRLSLSLTRGIYKARFKAADRMADELFEVGDTPITVHGPALTFSSPIPLNNTSTNHEYHYYPSRDLASKPPFASVGSGGQVFVFARDSRQQYNAPPPGPPQWQGLCIRNAKHQNVFDIDPNGVNLPQNGFASAKIELNPGLYYLEQPDCAHTDMVLKLPFVVCAGWCTHVYVDSRDGCKRDSPTSLATDEPVFKQFVRKLMQYTFQKIGATNGLRSISPNQVDPGAVEKTLEDFFTNQGPDIIPYKDFVPAVPDAQVRSAADAVDEAEIQADIELDSEFRRALATLPDISSNKRSALLGTNRPVTERRTTFSLLASERLSVREGQRDLIEFFKVAMVLKDILVNILRRYRAGSDHGFYATAVEECMRTFGVEVSGINSEQRVLDLAGAAMVMLRLNASTQLDEDVARLSEIARQGLMHSQEAVSAQDLEEMLDGKREYPMLGLYAAHVLLARPEKNWDKVARIAQHLVRWLGSGHPDVDVLLRLCAKHGIATNQNVSGLWPPLLAASWDLAMANKIELGHPEGRGDWQRQYRIGGSMWSCLYAPKRLAEIAAGKAVRNTSSKAPPASGPRGVLEAARDVIAAIPRSAGAVFEMGKEAVDWKQKLQVVLQKPNPEWSPFEQAVRRRVLDLLGDEDDHVSLKDIGEQVKNLAAQFQLPDDEADDVLGNLVQRIRD